MIAGNERTSVTGLGTREGDESQPTPTTTTSYTLPGTKMSMQELDERNDLVINVLDVPKCCKKTHRVRKDQRQKLGMSFCVNNLFLGNVLPDSILQDTTPHHHKLGKQKQITQINSGKL